MSELIEALRCCFGKHKWQKRVVVPGQYVQATVEVCERCGKGEREYREALGHYAYHALRARP